MQIADDTLDVVLSTLLAGGHLLLEDRPGVGKTQLARTLAGSVDGRFARVQATVDLLPTDILGATIWHAGTETFEFHPGPVFANVVLVDELNRATPKTQSGLLEAMQELQVTLDGRTHPLERPFMVIATQNPSVGYDGTYRLPPAQLDRFLARVSLGYPTDAQEIALLREPPSGGIERAGTLRELLAAQALVEEVRASEALLAYVVAVLEATRVTLSETGASPRAGLQLLGAARARAALQGRDFSCPTTSRRWRARPRPPHRARPRRARRGAARDRGGRAERRAGAVIRRGALVLGPARARRCGGGARVDEPVRARPRPDGGVLGQLRGARLAARRLDRDPDDRSQRGAGGSADHAALQRRRPARAAGAGRGAGRGGALARARRREGRVTYMIDRPGAHVSALAVAAARRPRPLRARARGGAAESLLVLPAPRPAARLRPGGARSRATPSPTGCARTPPGRR